MNGPTSCTTNTIKIFGSGGIRTHAPEETGALNQRLRPLGHATSLLLEETQEISILSFLIEKRKLKNFSF